MVLKICAQPIPSIIVSACDSGRLTVFLSFSGPTGIPSAYDIPSPWRNVFQDEPRSTGIGSVLNSIFWGQSMSEWRGKRSWSKMATGFFLFGMKTMYIYVISRLMAVTAMGYTSRSWPLWWDNDAEPMVGMGFSHSTKWQSHNHHGKPTATISPPLSCFKKKVTRKHLQSPIISCLIILKTSSRLSPPFATRVAHLLFLSLQCELFENQLGPAFGHRERPAAIRHRYGGDVAVDIAMVGMIADQRWTKKNLKKTRIHP